MGAQDMDAFLAEYYGTGAAVKTAAAQQEDVEKQASVDLFMKLATEQNIDLSKMEPSQVNELYATWVKAASAPDAAGGATKTAASAEEEEEKKKHEEAKKEHGEKKAQAEKVAEADFLGRVMAHAYCQEMRKIASTAAAPRVKTAEEEKEEKEEKEKSEKEHKDGKGGKHELPPGFMANLKHGSAIDTLAATEAVRIAAGAGFDPDQAGRKIAAVLELGLAKPSEKTASAPDYAAAVGIRALELLESAGYPVTWAEAQ